MYLPLSGYTQTTDAPPVTTTNLGLKAVYDDSVPSATAFLDVGFEDYKTLWGMNGTQVDVWFITKDNKFVMTPSAGEFKGFRCEIYCPKDFPSFENPNESHPVYLFFKDIAEYEDMVVMVSNLKISDIEDLVPIGLDIVQTSAVSSGDCTVKVTLRGSLTGKAGLTDWDILDSNVDTPTVSDSDDGGGVYTLTLQKAGPVDITAGDYMTIQGKIVAAGFTTYLTHKIKISA
jgi:hypothetical protein